ncbi:MAG: polyprenyl synthetase family protein [Betaproteobacteria bacterium]|nr:polyprenyl synthetase family protein [Betaproteobacteria bacterium]
MTREFDAWARDIALSTERSLEALLPPPAGEPKRLHDAMRYATLGGGKRVRPMLAHAAGETTGAPVDRVRIVAAAVEIIHAYSLAHDDLPCMDNDVLRRGKPTVHVEFDEATALLAGDALQALAFELMAVHRLADPPDQQLKMLQIFSHACGSHGMAGGQAIDLANVGRQITLPELEYMHILKTGALIRASVLLGAMCGAALPEEPAARLDHYGKCVGLAFQVVDDILDCESNTEQLGKTAGKDQDANKPTYVSLMGLAGAKAFARELLQDALSALAGFGPEAVRLRQLAEFIVHRQH